MKQTCILVLGMHRSGTSALTGLLSFFDVYLGSDLMQANHDNQKGHFENNLFYTINEKLLTTLESSWDDVFFNMNKSIDIVDTNQLKEQLLKEFEYSSVFAIKDPRLVFLFPIYEQVLNKMDIEIKIIVPYRNPMEVANSLKKRNGFSTEKGLLLWAYHILLAEKFTRKYDRIFLNFDSLLNNTDESIKLLQEKLNIPFIDKFIDKKEQITRFLEPGLKHHNISPNNLSKNIPKIILDILKQEEFFNNKKIIRKKFDFFIKELFNYQKLFYNDDIIQIFVDIKNIQYQLEKKNERILELQEEVQEKNKWAFDLDGQIKQLETALKGREEYITGLECSLEEKERLEEEYTQIVNGQIKQLETALKGREEYITGLECSLEEKERLEEELKKRLKEAQDLNNKILNSGGWKVLKKYYNLKEISMIALQAMAHPLQLSKVANRTYWYGFFRHLKSGNYAYILERMNYYIKTKPSQIQLELMREAHADEVLTFPIVKNPKVSIVIPVYNQFHYTYNCLKSILAHTNDIYYEIIIADDVSNDETRHIEHFCKNIKVVRNDINLGFLLNCNNAAKEARGKYIFFLNNDTNVQEYWLSTLLETIENDKTIGMVGSKLVYADGRQQEAGGIIWNDASGWNFGRLDNPEKPEYNYVKEVDYISGAAIMIRKSLWDEIGGFDERYVPAYYEDSDLAFEVRKNGYKVVLQPKSVVVHFEGISNGTDTGSGIKKYQVVNNEKFFDKWKEVLEREHFPNAQDIFLARDKSKDKKHILIIDHYVPFYDKDAGSRTMWQYLLFFRELDYQVTFVGDNFHKHEPYTSILENAGIEILYGPDIHHNFDNWLELNGRYFDFVYLLRPHIAIKYIDKIKTKTDAKIFYNGTDFHFLRMQREHEISKDKKLLKEIENMEEQEVSLFEKSDCVLTISEYEKDYFQQRFPNWDIKVIPTFIYKEKFPLSKNSDFFKREGILFVGGFTHAPNVEGVKWFLKEIWPIVTKLNPKIKFYIVGSNVPDDIKAMEAENILIKGFIEDSELENLYNQVKLVVAPLTFGAGVKGKIIESICHGIPVITTNIGAEGIVENENILSIKDTSQEFAKEIIALYEDEDKCLSIRKEQISYAQKYFSQESAKKLIQQIFNKENHE